MKTNGRTYNSNFAYGGELVCYRSDTYALQKRE